MEQNKKPKKKVFCSVMTATAHLIVPLEVRCDGELHFQSRTCNRLQVHSQVQFRELVHIFVDSLAHFWHSDELA